MQKYSLSLILLIVTVLCSSSKVFSATQYTGCLYSGYIYYTPDGTSGGVPNYKKNPTGARVLQGSAFCVATVSGSCRIDKKVSMTGSLRTFYLTQCPLDDYVPLLIILVGGLGFFMLRRGKLQVA